MSPTSLRQDQVRDSSSTWNLWSVGLFAGYVRLALIVRTSAPIQSATRLTSSARTWSRIRSAFCSGVPGEAPTCVAGADLEGTDGVAIRTGSAQSSHTLSTFRGGPPGAGDRGREPLGADLDLGQIPVLVRGADPEDVGLADLVQHAAVVGQEDDLDLAGQVLEHREQNAAALLVEVRARIVQ